MDATNDQNVLEHIARYRLTLRKTVELLFLHGRSSANVFQRLRTANLVEARDGLDGGLSYYQLTSKGAAHLGAKGYPARSFNARSLHNHLATLWFACMANQRRHRIEGTEFEQLTFFQAPQGSIIHCIEPEHVPRVYRLYIPNANTPVDSVVRQLTDRIDETLRSEPLASWVASRQYAFAALLHNDNRRDAVNRKLRHMKPKAHIIAELAPTPHNLHEFLRRFFSEGGASS